MLDRYRVVSPHDNDMKRTATKRGTEKWAELARGIGIDAGVEPTSLCDCCGLHGCPGGADCPDADTTRREET